MLDMADARGVLIILGWKVVHKSCARSLTDEALFILEGLEKN
jgi:hypothetical protein